MNKRYVRILNTELRSATEKGGEKMVNSNKIKGRMKELEITQAEVARKLNIAQPTANQKINNVRPFDLDEAEKLADLLEIEQSEFADYFFA